MNLLSFFLEEKERWAHAVGVMPRQEELAFIN